ncbi:MAG: hypothetical protein ACLUFY_06970 [[Ruminococcus] torques]|jgi:hypothetical protein
MSKKSVIIIFVCLLLCSGMIIGAIFFRNNRNSDEKQLSDSISSIAKLNQLENEKFVLEKRLLVKKELLEKQAKGKGTISFVCVGTHRKAYDVVFAETRNRNIPCTIVLTTDLNIDVPKGITTSQLREMVDSGWEIALAFPTGSNHPISKIKESIQKLDELGFEVGHTVYFNRSEYTANYDRELYNLGFYSVIEHGESQITVDSNGITLSAADENSIWKVRGYGYAQVGKVETLSRVKENGGSVFIEVSFDSSYLWSYCIRNSLVNVFSRCLELDMNTVCVKPVSGVHDYLISQQNGEISVDSKLEAEVMDLEKKITDIEAEIRDLRDFTKK